MPSLSEPQWQIQNNGQEYGPYARARILEMLAAGELPDAAAIRQQGMSAWLPVPAARELFQSYQAGGSTLAAAQAPAPAAASGPAPRDEEGEEAADAAPEAWDDAVDFEQPPPAPAGPMAVEEEAKPATRSKRPFLYAAVALLVLVAAVWQFGRGAPVGMDGYAKVKEELVHRMDNWRDRGVRLESVAAGDVEGPLVRYTIDPPGAIGEQDASYTFVVHCTFRDARGAESESKMTVAMGEKRLRIWNLFSK